MTGRFSRTSAHAKTLRGVLPVVVPYLLVSCAGPSGKPQPAQTARIDVVAASMLNPTDDGRPSPVVVKLYELASRGDFDRARFVELADDEKAPLPGLVARATLTVQPGAHLVLERTLDGRTRALGVVAGYQGIDEAQWRASVDLGRTPVLALSIDVGARAVALSEDKDATREANRGAIARWTKTIWQKLKGVLGTGGAQQ